MVTSANLMVSVILPTYNRASMLERALRSIIAQTYQNFEIIVINDAGGDVDSIINTLDLQERIRYIKHDSNRGLAAARNTGIRAARGKYIAYLDDDDIFYPNHLKTLCNFLENSEYRIAYADTCRVLQEMKKGSYEVTRKDTLSTEFDYDQILVGNLIPVLCFMHEKSCLDETGLFDETLTSHEDWDLWIRMSRRFKIAHIKEVTSEFSWRLDGSTMSSSRRDDFVRTLEIIYGKYEKYVIEKPGIVKLQRKNLILQKEQKSEKAWIRREKLKMALSRIIGIKGINFLYRMKLWLCKTDDEH
jgi:glycosyltransferase involved in cell wall biosynthesis